LPSVKHSPHFFLQHGPKISEGSSKQKGNPIMKDRSSELSCLRWLVFALALVCSVFSTAPNAFGVTPAPDGGYPNYNTAEGTDALFNLTSGQHNTALGNRALYNDKDGFYNTAVGSYALELNQSGLSNTATGFEALYSNTGSQNTATGALSLLHNTGSDNTATGYFALGNNTTGEANTAGGFSALISNRTGAENTANGFDAMFSNTTGTDNTADGAYALYKNNGNQNLASGVSALYNNTTGHDNTAAGFQALGNNATGINNVAIGSNAGGNLTTGDNNIVIGANVPGVVGEANTIRIGKSGLQKKTLIAGISGKTVASGVGVIINSSGQLGTVQSSARYKDNIKPMDKASEAILALKPVTFRYKEELDPKHIPQFGLIAEEVEKVDPDLIARDEDGKVMTVRYEAVNAMLLNEFLKEHHKVEELEQQIETLTATVQKVSKQIETNKSALKVAAND
jgi:Chaperone of endosialidase